MGQTVVAPDPTRGAPAPPDSGRRRVPAVALVAAAAVVLGLLHLLWLARFRWGYVTDWDEAGYLAIALRYHDGLVAGPRAFLDVLDAGGAQPPLVPASAVPLFLLFGRSVDVGQVTVSLFSVALVLATYGAARHLMAARWAALAAVLVGTAPVVSDYTRLFHFAVPAAAFLTAAIWALLNSDGLRRRRWVVAAGVLLGCMLLSRSMTVSYLPGVVLGAGLPLLVRRERRRSVVVNFGIFLAATVAVAATWWGPAWGQVTTYLSTTGYGANKTAYGDENPILSADFWAADLRVIVNYLYVPLVVALLACFVAFAIHAATARREREGLRARIRAWLTSAAFLPVVVVVEGYLSLLSTSTEGTAFSLPWLPALVILGVAAAAAVRLSAVRVGLAALLVTVGVVNLAMKNGVSSGLSKPQHVEVPFLGTVTVKNGHDFMYQALAGRGYAVSPPPARLPPMHERWSVLNQEMARFIASHPSSRSRPPVVTIATGDYLINNTRLQLAHVLDFRRAIQAGIVRPAPTVEGYRSQLAAAAGNVLVMAEPPPATQFPMDGLKLAAAALELGFREATTFTAPDGRRVFVWWRQA